MRMMLLAHSQGKFQPPELDAIGDFRLQLVRRPRVAVRVLAHSLTTNGREEI
jgi:hypothetical protein